MQLNNEYQLSGVELILSGELSLVADLFEATEDLHLIIRITYRTWKKHNLAI